MSRGGFRGRSSDLEEKFFRERDMQLLQELRERLAVEERRKALAEASGITHPELLDTLNELGVCRESLAALLLVPLVEVAWADGTLYDKERQAVMAALAAKGVGHGHPAYRLMENWLQRKPYPELLRVWKEYVAALKEVLDPEEKKNLRDDLLQRARAVAEAAGGILGFGNRVSKPQQAMLDELAKAFD